MFTRVWKHGILKVISTLPKNTSEFIGLYGILRPLDLIQAHARNGHPIQTLRVKTFMLFGAIDWLTQLIRIKAKSKIVVNLASQEYFKAACEKDFRKNYFTGLQGREKRKI